MDNNNYQNYQSQPQASGFVSGPPNNFGAVPPYPPPPPLKRAPFIQGLPILAAIPFIQAILLWFCLSDFLEDLFYAYELSFPLPVSTCMLAPLFLYLNWDFWRPGSRRVLAGMTLGVGIIFFLFDLYSYWAGVSDYDIIAEVTFFLGFALILVLPVFRQRLFATGSQAGRAQAEASIFKDPPADEIVPPYSAFPAAARAWIPQGRFYLEELIRASILLFAGLVVCGVAGIFIFIMGEMIDSAMSWYYYGSGLELFAQFVVCIMMAYAAATGVGVLGCLRPISIFSHLVLKISAWGNFLALLFAVFGLMMLPLVIYFESEMYSYFVLCPVLVLGLMAAASSRLFGPLSHPVCTIITRVGAFLPVLFAITTIWQIYLHWQDYYLDTEDVIVAVYVAWLFLFAVAAAAAGGANRLYQWFSVLTPAFFMLAALLILLMLSPVLSPYRIAASSYAQYIVDEEYQQEYTYSHLYYSYNIWGERELEELARRPGETEKDRTIRELAQMIIDNRGSYSYNEPAPYDYDDDSGESAYPTREEQEAQLRRLPVWPAGKVVPDKLYEDLVDPYYLSLDENTCSRFFVADFNQDGLDDVMFLDSARGYWTIYKAVNCAKFENMGYAVCDYELDYYKEELETEKHTMYVDFRHFTSGYVNSDYDSGDKLCRELTENLEKGVIGLEPPKPDSLHLRIGDMLIESGR